MSINNLQDSLQKAAKRLDRARARGRKRRSDRGTMRLDPRVARHLDAVLSGQERPPMRAVLSGLGKFCAARGLDCPSRATVYKYMAKVVLHRYEIASLPFEVKAALYNLSSGGSVPGHQLAFYSFNYGDLRAVSFAAGLPWLDLYQALRMRGFRSKSRGLLMAAARVRGI